MPDVSSFDYARLAALKQYSDLENQLVSILQYALSCDYLAAKTVLFQISSTRVRYQIIANLLRSREEGAYFKAWKWIERELGRCDEARNELVHWAEKPVGVISLVNGDDPADGIRDVQWVPHLQNPKSTSPNSPMRSEKDIWERRDHMRVMLHIINRMGLVMHHPDDWPWCDIYQQPIDCQSTEELLQRLNHEGRPAPLPPYEKKVLPLYNH